MINKQQLTKQLKTLVETRSLSGDIDNNTKALDFVETLINKEASVERLKNKSEKLSFETEILMISNLKDATRKQMMNPEFGFIVHIDVVAAEEELWTMKITEENGSTIARGRGVSDMKYSIPMGISILNDLIQNKSKKTMTMIITTDEEVGGFGGAEYLVEELKFRPKVIIVPDGGDEFIFVEKSKGIVQIKLTASGIPAHASRPWKGKNAIATLNKVLTPLLAKYEKNSVKENWNTTMNIGLISGGVSTNQVCPSAQVTLDFRFPETRSVKEVFDEVKAVAKGVDKGIKVEAMSSGDPTFTDANLTVSKVFIKTINNNIDQTLVVGSNPGASDARFFSPYNIPIMMTKPMGGDIHESTEWVSIDSCMQYMAGVMEFIDNWTI